MTLPDRLLDKLRGEMWDEEAGLREALCFGTGTYMYSVFTVSLWHRTEKCPPGTSEPNTGPREPQRQERLFRDEWRRPGELDADTLRSELLEACRLQII